MKKLAWALPALMCLPGVSFAVQIPDAQQVLHGDQQSWDMTTLIMNVGLLAVGVVIGLLAVKGLWVTVTGALEKLRYVKEGQATMADVAAYAMTGLGILALTVVVGWWLSSMWGG